LVCAGAKSKDKKTTMFCNILRRRYGNQIHVPPPVMHDMLDGLIDTNVVNHIVHYSFPTYEKLKYVNFDDLFEVGL